DAAMAGIDSADVLPDALGRLAGSLHCRGRCDQSGHGPVLVTRVEGAARGGARRAVRSAPAPGVHRCLARNARTRTMASAVASGSAAMTCPRYWCVGRVLSKEWYAL